MIDAWKQCSGLSVRFWQLEFLLRVHCPKLADYFDKIENEVMIFI